MHLDLLRRQLRERRSAPWLGHLPATTLAAAWGHVRCPPAVVDSWKPRAQQIFPGESLCLVVLPLLYSSHLQDSDWLWFLDNQAAVSAAVKSMSTEQDVFEIAHYAALIGARMNARAWHDWVDSESNLSDGLSREGLDCSWSQSQPWHLEQFALPAAGYRDMIPAELMRGETVGWDCRVEIVGFTSSSSYM